MDMIFAFSETTVLTWHGSLNRVHTTINFYASTSSITPIPGYSSLGSLLILHSISMYIAFTILFPLGIYVARYYRNLGRWLSIHTSLLTSITSNVIVAALTAIIGTFGNPNSLHYKIGMAVIILVSISSIAGYCATKLHLFNHSWSYLASVCRQVHKYSGFLAYVVGLVDCYFGVGEISPDSPYTIYLQIIFLVSAILPPVCLFAYGESQKKMHFLSKDMMGLNNLPSFRWEDVNHRVSLGAKWIVIDEVIYDVQKYMDCHPGGSHALQQMIGIDAAFAFNNTIPPTKPMSYLTNGSSSHTGTLKSDTLNWRDEKLNQLMHSHSRYARNLLSTFAMGTLKDHEQKHPNQNEGSKPTDICVHKFAHYIISSKILITNPNARHPVYLFRIAFEDDQATIQSKPGDSYLFQFVDDDGRMISRSYTPIKMESKGFLEFMIKMYNGEMTHYLNYANIHLLFANLDETSIFAEKEIAELEAQGNGAITVTYIISSINNESTKFDGLLGRISPEVIVATMPKPQVIKKGPASHAGSSPYGTLPHSVSNSLLRARGKPANFGDRDELDSKPILTPPARDSESSSIRSSGVMGGGDMDRENEEAANMAIIVCGPILMNVTVGDMLRNLGYTNILTA
ncbi:hypothetical protein HDU98_003734 [Podochytrium sp. JEL0797]|nr:hypothetical protein HDU98_003734 [Podochytrium sp. JEL0797]